MSVSTRIVSEDEADLRLDRWFRRHFPNITQGAIQKFCRTGQVRVDGHRVEAAARLAPGQAVRVPPLPAAPPPPAPPLVLDNATLRELAAMVLYQDDQVIVLNKPPGLPVQGGPGITRHLDGMLDGLRFGSPHRPRLVHRLDRDTSGVLVLARSPGSAAKLDAAHAITDYRTLDHAARKLTWLELQPVTGRTHQLRVHCVALRTPILGDSKYHQPDQNNAFTALIVGLSEKLHLHARALSLPHPAGGSLLVEAPLPTHMAETFTTLGFDAPPPVPARRAAR